MTTKLSFQQWWPQWEQFWWNCELESPTVVCLRGREEESTTVTLDHWRVLLFWREGRCGWMCRRKWGFLFVLLSEEEIRACLYVSVFLKKTFSFDEAMASQLASSSLVLFFWTHCRRTHFAVSFISKIFRVSNCCMKSPNALVEHSNFLQFGLLQFDLAFVRALWWGAKHARPESEDLDKVGEPGALGVWLWTREGNALGPGSFPFVTRKGACQVHASSVGPRHL